MFKVLGLGLDEILGLGLGLVIKSLVFSWPCQFALENVHREDSQVTVSCQCLSGNICISLLLKVLILADIYECIHTFLDTSL